MKLKLTRDQDPVGGEEDRREVDLAEVDRREMDLAEVDQAEVDQAEVDQAEVEGCPLAVQDSQPSRGMTSMAMKWRLRPLDNALQAKKWVALLKQREATTNKSPMGQQPERILMLAEAKAKDLIFQT